MPTETKTGPVNLQPGEFDTLVLKATTPVLVDFWAPWCGPCRMVAPILDELAGTYAGRLAIVKVNVDNHPDLAAQYEIRSIPSLLVFKNGQVVETIVGAVPRRALEQKLAPFTA